MNWITLYITGRSDFREEVRRKLEHSNLQVMPGYIDSTAGKGVHDLYWLEEATDIRTVKLVIGSKLIWKYRLTFFDTLEAFQQWQNSKARPVSMPKRRNTSWKRSKIKFQVTRLVQPLKGYY